MSITVSITKQQPKTIYRNFSGEFRPVKISVKNVGIASVILRDSNGNMLLTLDPAGAIIFTYDGKQSSIEAIVSGDDERGLIEIE